MPGLRVIRTYDRSWLSRDLVAAVVLSALLVPQGMAYAELAGLPAITGLYTTVVCLLAYAAFGSSRYLVLGPDSSLGPIIAAIILPLAAGSEERAVALAGMLALLVGALALGTGIARLGFVADLLSQPVRIGYMAGLAVTIFASQLPQLFGFSIDGGNLIEDIVGFVRGLDQTHWLSLAIGLIALVIILGLAFAGLNGPVKDKIERYGLYHTIDPTHFYPNISSAVEAIQDHINRREPDPAPGGPSRISAEEPTP